MLQILTLGKSILAVEIVKKHKPRGADTPVFVSSSAQLILYLDFEDERNQFGKPLLLRPMQIIMVFNRLYTGGK